MDNKRGNEKLQRRTQSNNDVLCILAFCDTTVSQIPLALRRFGTLQVTTKCTAVLGLAGSGDFEPLFHGLMSFLLRHRSITNNYVSERKFARKMRAAEYSVD